MSSDASITKKDLDSAIAGAVESISEVIGSFANQVDARFTQVNARFTGIENQLAEVKQDTVDLKVSHERLLNTVDAFVKRLDDYEAEQAARDAQFARLLEWAREVSKKTGVPMPNP